MLGKKACVDLIHADRYKTVVAAMFFGFLVVAGLRPAYSAPSEVPAAATPAPSPSPIRRLLIFNGPQVIVIGAAIPRVQSEFQPRSAVGPASFEGWHTGETTLLGRFHVLSFTDYRSFSYFHNVADPVVTVGGNGTATVPSFRVHDDELESGGGVRVLPRIYFGAALFKRQETSGYPALTGAGYALMFAPAPRQPVTPYGWVTYQPNAGGIYALPDGSHTALTYRGVRYRFGVLIGEPGTRLVLDVGFAGENLDNRTNVPLRTVDSMLTVGLGIHF
jgi:hypothetical protein